MKSTISNESHGNQCTDITTSLHIGTLYLLKNESTYLLFKFKCNGGLLLYINGYN